MTLLKKLEILQKRALRIINMKERTLSHMDPLFKSKQKLKIVDVFKLQASLFMYDFDHNVLPKSFRNVVINIFYHR